MTHPIPRWILLLPTLLCLGGCKRDIPCHGEISKDDLYRLQKRLEDGEEVCPQWVRPKISVRDSGIVLDGRAIANGSVLPTGRMGKVEPLREQLKSGRELWKMLHPAKMFEATVSIDIQPDLESLTVASVLQTVAYAGYPYLQIDCGTVKLGAVWAVPMPPNPDNEGPETIRIGRTAQGWYELRFEGPVSKKERPPGWTLRDPSSLVSTITDSCASREGGCARVLEIEATREPFVNLANLLRELWASPAFGKRLPAVRLVGPGSS